MVATKALAKAGTRSKYKNDDSKIRVGCKLKLPIYSLVQKLWLLYSFQSLVPTRELPQDQRVSEKIKGLCVGRGGVTVSNKKHGTILFMRGDKGMG